MWNLHIDIVVEICVHFSQNSCMSSIFTARVHSTREGFSFTLLVCSQGGGVRSSRRGGSGPAGGGIRSSWRGEGGSGPAGGGGGGVRSSWWGVEGVRSVQPGGGEGSGQSSRGGGSGQSSQGGVSQRGGGSASCALLRAVCLMRSRRRTFLFGINFSTSKFCLCV